MICAVLVILCALAMILAVLFCLKLTTYWPLAILALAVVVIGEVRRRRQ